MLHVAASHWVTALEDHHAISKRRVLVTQRRGATFENDENLNIMDVKDIRHTNSDFIMTVIVCFGAHNR